MQDLYIRELKNYKPPPVKPSDSEGHVQKFSPPRAPQSPEESDIANDLKAYENQQVELEGQASGGEAAKEEDWFEDEVRASSQYLSACIRSPCFGRPSGLIIVCLGPI